MNRTAKANAKRASQQARRDERAAGVRGESPLDDIVLPTEDAETPADPPADEPEDKKSEP